jgi:hypothetical protein
MKGFLGSFLAGRAKADDATVVPPAELPEHPEGPGGVRQLAEEEDSPAPTSPVVARTTGKGGAGLVFDVNPWGLPDEQAEADRLLTELRTGLSVICRQRFGGDAWPARLAERMADALAIAEGYVSGAAKEIAGGANPLDLLRRQVAFALGRARKVPAQPHPNPFGVLGGITLPSARPAPPSVPKGAKLFFQDENGRPTDARHAALWCWEGGPRWYKTEHYPIPVGNRSG